MNETTPYKDIGCHLRPSCLDCDRAECYLVEADNGGDRINKKYNKHEGSIKMLRDAGLSPSDISAKLGVPKRTVYRNIQVWKPKMTKKRLILQLHGMGMSRQEISNMTGASYSYIRLVVYKYLQKPLSEEL
jgi:transposase